MRQLNDIFRRFDEGIMNEENVDNLQVMMASLRVASERIEEASTRFVPILDETSEVIQTVNATAEETRTTLGEVSGGVREFSETLDQLRGTLESVNALMGEFESGDGLADALLNDEELRRDLSNFVDKLERNGILFYPRERNLFRNSDGSDRKPTIKPMGKP